VKKNIVVFIFFIGLLSLYFYLPHSKHSLRNKTHIFSSAKLSQASAISDDDKMISKYPPKKQNQQQSNQNSLKNQQHKQPNQSTKQLKNNNYNSPSQSINTCSGMSSCTYPIYQSTQDLIPAYLAEAKLCLKNPNDVLVNASFIYWQALANDNYVGIYDNYQASSLFSPIDNHEHFAEFDNKFHPGFKVSINFTSKNDNWNVLTRYTWFYFTEKKSFSNDSSEVYLLTPWYANFNNTNGDITLEGKWKLKQNIFDFEINRPSQFSQNLIFKPHLGLKGFYISQSMNTIEQPVQLLALNIQGLTFNTAKGWGLGARTGVDMNFMLTSNFYMFGNPSLSLAFQHYTLKRHQRASNTISNEAMYRDNKTAISPILEFPIGFGYGTFYKENYYYFDFIYWI